MNTNIAIEGNSLSTLDAVDMNSDSFDAVLFLLNNSIDSLSFEQKVLLKSKISRPALSLSQKDGKIVRKFQQVWYGKFKWLSGCKQNQTLHCYYCLMFNGEEPWKKVGLRTIKNFEAKAMKHAGSKTHIKNAEMFHMLGRSIVDFGLSETTRIQAMQHNEIVVRNRRIVGRLIDVVCYLGRQEMAFQYYNESNQSLNNSCYLETLNLLAMEESFMKEHLETSTVFKDISTDIQNDLIESVTIAINETIRKEINQADFISIQADEVTDVSVGAQLSIIVRYVHELKIKERFLGFCDVSADKSAEGIASKIILMLKEYNIDGKLVSQTYDGASLMAGCRGEVQALVRKQCPQAIFVHCYAHQLNLVLLYSAKTIKEVKLFICNLTAFHTFFSRSSARSELLREKGFKLPHPEATHWNYYSWAVSTIEEHYQEIRRAVVHIVESDDWDPHSVNAAIGLLNILNSTSFIFYLSLYSRIFIFTEHLFQILQAKSTSDINMCINEIKTVKSNIASLRSEEVLQNCLEDCKHMSPNPNCTFPESVSQLHKRVAFEILDSVTNQLDIRFSNFEDISFVELLNEKKYKYYRHNFPQSQFDKLKSLYPKFFKWVTLHNELVIIYNNDYKVLPCLKLLQFIVENEMDSVYDQTLKLLKLILSIPLTSASTEQSMSTLQRIKSYLRNSMTDRRLSNLATLSIEKELASQCSKNSLFKERVIDIFSELKTRRMELIYTKI